MAEAIARNGVAGRLGRAARAVAARRPGRAVKVSFFETVRYALAAGAAARVAGAVGGLRPRGRRRGLPGHDRASRSTSRSSASTGSASPSTTTPRASSPRRRSSRRPSSPPTSSGSRSRCWARSSRTATRCGWPRSWRCSTRWRRGAWSSGCCGARRTRRMTYDLNPQEARERTDEGMELILKAWTEPQPFGWQGRHFQYRTVSIWPRPLQQPHPPTFALGTSRESCEFAARHRLGCGVSYGPFEVMAKATRYYREQCARHGWEPTPEQIIYRANMLVAETDEEAQALLRAQSSSGAVRHARGRPRRRRRRSTPATSRARRGRRRDRRAADDVRGQPGHRRRAGPALPRGGRRGRPRPVAAPARLQRCWSRSCARSSCSATKVLPRIREI